MAVASTGVHWYDSVVRGQDINNVWTVFDSVVRGQHINNVWTVFDSVVRGQHINNVWTVLTDNTYNASCRKMTTVVM